MKAYSTDLREKIALLYDTNDYSLNEVADLFGVGRRTVARFVQKYRVGISLAPQPHAGGYPAVLTPEIRSVLRNKVTETPDATLLELTSYLKTKAHVSVHLSTVCRALQTLGLPRKKRRWRPLKEMNKSVRRSGSRWHELIAVSSSLLTKQAFIWPSRAPLAVPHAESGSSAMCRSTEERITPAMGLTVSDEADGSFTVWADDETGKLVGFMKGHIKLEAAEWNWGRLSAQ